MVEFSASEVPSLRLFWGFESRAPVFHSISLLNEPFAAKVEFSIQKSEGWRMKDEGWKGQKKQRMMKNNNYKDEKWKEWRE
jgi:hypothetical protein